MVSYIQISGKETSYSIVQINCNKGSNKSSDSVTRIVAVLVSWIDFSDTIQGLATEYIFSPYDNDEDELLLEELLLSKLKSLLIHGQNMLIRGKANKRY